MDGNQGGDNFSPEKEEFRVTKLWTRTHRYPGPAWKLAAECNFSPTTLSQYINGRIDIIPKHLVALCVALDCEPDDIIGWADSIQTTEQLEEALSATG